MKFIAKENASARTKNRIREHNGSFVVKEASSSVQSLNGCEGLLLQSESGWLGWLPSDEITADVVTYGGFGQTIEQGERNVSR